MVGPFGNTVQKTKRPIAMPCGGEPYVSAVARQGVAGETLFCSHSGANKMSFKSIRATWMCHIRIMRSIDGPRWDLYTSSSSDPKKSDKAIQDTTDVGVQ